MTRLIIFLRRVALIIRPSLSYEKLIRFLILLVKHIDDLEYLVHLEIVHVLQLLDVVRDVR